MNITDSIANSESSEMVRTCSRISTSTASSLGMESPKSEDLPTSFFIPSVETERLAKKEAELDSQSLDMNMENIQKEMVDNCESMKMCEEVQEVETEAHDKEELPMEEEIRPNFDFSIYLKKRSKIMEWIQSYSSQLCLSKSSTSLAHQFTDIYFHSFPLEQVQLTLTAILILCSKNCDHKVLYTSHTAYICDLDVEELGKRELNCLAKMDGNFPDLTYARMVDLAIWESRQFWNFYAEGQEEFLRLSMAHGIVETLYIEFYEWEPNMEDIRYALLLAVKKYSPNSLLPYLQKHGSSVLPRHHLKIEKVGEEWIDKNEENFRETYENRKTLEEYTNYEEFCVRYFNF